MVNFLYSIFIAFLYFINFSGKPDMDLPPKAGVEEVEAVSFAVDDDLVLWDFDRRLTWDDFLCEPVRNTEAVALTSTTLGLAYRVQNSVLSYNINCGFSKSRSWGLLKTPYILAHEQAHFDITELYARKLHKELQQHKFVKGTSMQKQINAIYEKVMKEKEAFQELYDTDTSHSRNKKKQEEWLEQLDNLLVETEYYAAYP
jgi:hypothetical protein